MGRVLGAVEKTNRKCDVEKGKFTSIRRVTHLRVSPDTTCPSLAGLTASRAYTTVDIAFWHFLLLRASVTVLHCPRPNQTLQLVRYRTSAFLFDVSPCRPISFRADRIYALDGWHHLEHVEIVGKGS